MPEKIEFVSRVQVFTQSSVVDENSMIVPVMGIRKMVMYMLQWRVAMPLIMIGLAHLIVFMPVMIIMGVVMLMIFRIMQMRVFVSFGQVQPDTECHEDSGNNKA